MTTFALLLLVAMQAISQNLSFALTDIIESYTPWKSAEFEGKLRTDKLPLSPTVRIYMERDSLLQISVRAPFVGEVGRFELTRDSIFVVNRMKKVYAAESTGSLYDTYPSMLSDLQGLLLARVVVLGKGEMSEEHMDAIAVEDDGEGNWLLIPETDPGAFPFSYGYVVGANARTRALLMTLKGHGSLELKYSYKNRGEQIEITLDRPEKNGFNAELDFSSVKWGGKRMSPVRVSSYSRVDLKTFISTLKK